MNASGGSSRDPWGNSLGYESFYELGRGRRAVHPQDTTADHPNSLEDRLLTRDDLRRRPAPKWLVDGLIPDGGLTVMYGPPGAGKSFLSIGLACSVSTGRAFLGHTISQTGAVLYVVGEGIAGIPTRVAAWEQANGCESDPFWLDGAVQLASYPAVHDLADLVSRLDIRLLVIDTLARCTAGVDENSSKELGNVIANVDRIRRPGCAVLIVHHSGKDPARGGRGSSALTGAADAELQVNGGVLKVTKMKDGPESPPVSYRLERVGDSAVAVTSSTSIEASTPSMNVALDALSGLCAVPGHSVGSTEWRESSGLPSSTFYKAKGDLLRLNLVEQLGVDRNARYRQPADQSELNLDTLQLESKTPSETPPVTPSNSPSIGGLEMEEGEDS